MIVGHGAIAKAITDRDDRIYFASGVANSLEMRNEEYLREWNLLAEQDTKKHLVYFSSLCVFTQDTRYARHKLEMEREVKRRFPRYTIMRLGNIEWAENPNQLIPFLKRKLKKREYFTIIDDYRHILSREDFDYWINHIPDWNCEMNVTGWRMKVAEIVGRYQQSKWTL